MGKTFALKVERMDEQASSNYRLASSIQWQDYMSTHKLSGEKGHCGDVAEFTSYYLLPEPVKTMF
jgi:hypothetical protein